MIDFFSFLNSRNLFFKFALVVALLSFSFSTRLQQEGYLANLSSGGGYGDYYDSASVLLNSALDFFGKNHTISQICTALSDDPKWIREGSLFFILDENATCFFAGDEKRLVWKNFADLRDERGMRIMDYLFNSDERSGKKSMVLRLNNSRINFFYKVAQIGEKKYAFCCGRYLVGREFIVTDLVNSCYAQIREGGLSGVKEGINDPYGAFVAGDIHLFLVDQDGRIHAKGDNQAQVGSNLFADYEPVDEFPTKKFKEVFASDDSETWMEYEYNKTLAKVFCKKFFQEDEKKNYLLCGVCYPRINNNSLSEFLEKSMTYLKSVGRDVAFRSFSKGNTDFVLGGSRITVFDLEGLCLASGEDPSLVGHNLYDKLSPYGEYEVRQLIEGTKKLGHYSSKSIERNAYKLVLSEKIVLHDGPVIVTSGYWLHSREEIAQSLVDRAVLAFKGGSVEESLRKFIRFDSDYLYADLFLFVLTNEGIFLSAGPNYRERIWSKALLKDDKGRLINKAIIQKGLSKGGGWLSFVRDGGNYRIYVRGSEEYCQSSGSLTGDYGPLAVAAGFLD